MLTAALFVGRNRRNRKQRTCPLTEAWVRRSCMYTVKYYLVIKKNKIMPFAATWMDLDYPLSRLFPYEVK